VSVNASCDRTVGEEDRALDDIHEYPRYDEAEEDRGELEKPGIISYEMGQKTKGPSNISWHIQGQDPWPFYKIGIEEGTGHKVDIACICTSSGCVFLQLAFW
jgi:hypothetical protein